MAGSSILGSSVVVWVVGVGSLTGGGDRTLWTSLRAWDIPIRSEGALEPGSLDEVNCREETKPCSKGGSFCEANEESSW